jgi:hypothetical protein
LGRKGSRAFISCTCRDQVLPEVELPKNGRDRDHSERGRKMGRGMAAMARPGR